MRLRVGHQHSQFWLILARFVDYYSPFWGPEAISIFVEPQGALTCRSSTLSDLAGSGPFHGLLLTVLGPLSDYHGCRTPRCTYVLAIKLAVWADFDPFLGLLLSFGVPNRFPRLMNPRLHLYVCRQHSQFWPILTCFVDYYSPFWGPGVISTINKPWGVFTFRSPTLAVLADTDLFRGLLLTVLGPRSDFHSC